jgi:sterol desaturase/sphingolipid hydroxylase (fatty acid hydroxylase superfamily)
VGPDITSALLEPVAELLGPHHRVFAPFLLTSLALAILSFRVAQRSTQAPRPRLLRYLFPRRLFLHRSSRLDVWWLGVRAICQALILWPLRVSVLGVAVFACGQVRNVAGSTPFHAPADRTWLFVAFTAGLFLADDATRYLVHRAMHAFGPLWELHKVHHSAEVLTPLTLYRVHPIESSLNQLRGGLAAGLVTGLFMWAFPGKLRAFEVLGVDALGFLWTALGANLRHSHVWLSFPPWVERWFISPAQHQMHHARSACPPGNYGSALAVWDRLCGTLLVSQGRRPPRVGIPRAERNHSGTVASALFHPMLGALRRLIPWLPTRPSVQPSPKNAAQ